MISALELENLGASSKCASQLLAIHGGFGARCAESKVLGSRTDSADLFGKLQHRLIQIGKIRPFRRLFADRLDHFGTGVADQTRAPTHREIDQLTPLGVPQTAPEARANRQQRVVRQPELAVRYASGENFQCPAPHVAGHALMPAVYPMFLCHCRSYAHVVPRIVTSVDSALPTVKLI